MKAKDLRVGKLYAIKFFNDEKNPGGESDFVGTGMLISKNGVKWGNESLYEFNLGFEHGHFAASHCLKEVKVDEL